MRIKSYFAPSVQAAIAAARQEFGEAVTLVTSHIAPPESRSFGEYEVVFAIEEKVVAQAPKEAPSVPTVPESKEQPVELPLFTGFQTELLKAVAGRGVGPQPNTVGQLANIRNCLIELGIDPGNVIRLMGEIESVVLDYSGQTKPDHSIASSSSKDVSVTVTDSAGGPTSAEALFAQCVAAAPKPAR
jgi:hypothetical protein